LDCLIVEGGTDRISRHSVDIYQFMFRHIAEEPRSRLEGGGSPKPGTVPKCI